MRNLTILLLFTTLFGYAQIDYKGLVRNLEEVNVDTDIPTFLKDLPFEERYSKIEFNDERFLRFYGVIIDKVTFTTGYRKAMYLTPFNEKADFEKIKAKFIELYGEPEINERKNSIRYEWETNTARVNLSINLKEDEEQVDEGKSKSDSHQQEEKQKGVFKEFDNLTITFKEQ